MYIYSICVICSSFASFICFYIQWPYFLRLAWTDPILPSCSGSWLSTINWKALTTITDENKAKERSLHKAWERSNRLSLMFIRMTIANNRSIIPRTESDEEYMEFLKEHSESKSVDKSHVGALMRTLTTCKFDCTCTMHQHVTKMIDTTVKLRSIRMEVSESFLVLFIINFFPSECGPFQINYNTIKDKNSMNDLQAMLI